MSKEPSGALLTTIWLGGVFFWLFQGFRGPFSAMIDEKYRGRNFAVGYLLTILSLLVLVGLAVRTLKS